MLPLTSHVCLLFVIASFQSRSHFLSALKPHLSDCVIPGKDLSLRFLSHDYNLGTPVDETPPSSTSELIVVTKPAPWQLQSLPFSSLEYFQRLETRELGRTLLHTPVITSTQLPFTGNLTFCQMVEPKMGVVWVAAQQTKGKGTCAVLTVSHHCSLLDLRTNLCYFCMLQIF